MIKIPETRYNPCGPAKAWLETQDDIDIAWQTCPKNEWMMWALRNVLVQPEQRLTVAVYGAMLVDPEYTRFLEDSKAMSLGEWDKQEELIKKRIILEIYPTWPGPR